MTVTYGDQLDKLVEEVKGCKALIAKHLTSEEPNPNPTSNNTTATSNNIINKSPTRTRKDRGKGVGSK